MHRWIFGSSIAVFGTAVALLVPVTGATQSKNAASVLSRVRRQLEGGCLQA